MVTVDKAKIIENVPTENTRAVVTEQPNPTSSRPKPTIRRRGTSLELQEAENQM